jgi:aminopeptidase N
MRNLNIILITLLFIVSVNVLSNDKQEIQSVQISSPVEYIPQAFDVIHYSAVLDFRKAPSKVMTGINKIKLFWTLPPADNLFYFHLRGLTVDSVKYNGLMAEFKVAEDESSPVYHYEVTPPSGAVQDTAIITVYYHGTMTNADKFGGVFSDNGILYSVGVGFRNNYVSTTQHWLACYDHPSDKATFDFSFITPRYLSVASNGILQSETDFIDGDSTYKLTKWASRHTIATNLMTFAVGDYIRLTDNNANYPIVIYCLQRDSAACRFVFKRVPEMIETYQNAYGKYVFDKVGYVITPLASGAMEHQTMITMNENHIRRMYADKDSFNTTAAHELSHHWFGNSVTPYDYRDAWFNEGFATFSESIWTEQVYGFNKYLSSISNRIDYYINYISVSEGLMSLYDFLRIPPSSNYPSTIYYKGAAVVAMLRYELGDELFFRAIKSYLDARAWGYMTAVKFENYLEDYTGRDLTWFFEQWVYRDSYPVIRVVVNKSKSQAEGYYKAKIHIYQVQPDKWGTFVNLPVEFIFSGLNGKRVSKVFRLQSRDEVFYIDSLPDFYAPIVNRGDSVRTLLKNAGVTTSVDYNDEDLNLEIYPNPTNDYLFLRLIDNTDISSITVIDVTGRIINRYSINDVLNNNLIKLDVRNLRTGTYFMTLETTKTVKTISFIKN